MAEDAVAAVADIQRKLASVEWSTPRPLRVRASLQTGRAELESGDYYGSTVNRAAQQGAGWVAEEALAIAVYCALAVDDFSEGVLLAVNHSGDSDSTGSIAGQILGATLGADAILTEWTDGLALRSVVARVAGDLDEAFHEGRLFMAEEYPPW